MRISPTNKSAGLLADYAEKIGENKFAALARVHGLGAGPVGRKPSGDIATKYLELAKAKLAYSDALKTGMVKSEAHEKYIVPVARQHHVDAELIRTGNHGPVQKLVKELEREREEASANI